MTRRTEQVSAVLAHIVGEIIQNELSDPRISGFVTITGAKVSPDLRDAIVYFSIFGEDADWNAAEIALNRAAGFIQKHMAERIILKETPRLKFVADHTMEQAQRIESILSNSRDARNSQK